MRLVTSAPDADGCPACGQADEVEPWPAFRYCARCNLAFADGARAEGFGVAERPALRVVREA